MSRSSALLTVARNDGSIAGGPEPFEIHVAIKDNHETVLVTQDEGLQAHWATALGKSNVSVVAQIADFSRWVPKRPSIVWVDLSLADLPAWDTEPWRIALKNESVRIVAASSNPNDAQAMEALDAGCAAYCHAFSDAGTLRQVRDVVHAGHVWIGKTLMQRLLRSVNRVANAGSARDTDWSEVLTPREVEVAILAANGASNQAIASQCQISERTVKAHLSAVFAKLNITDRLQLALRVHGIH
jgi:DNA-binding NarL/FixJ family response regulator